MAGAILAAIGGQLTEEEARRLILKKLYDLARNEILGTAEVKAGNGLAGALEEDARLTALSMVAYSGDTILIF